VRRWRMGIRLLGASGEVNAAPLHRVTPVPA
jgi:hypothetical protein